MVFTISFLLHQTGIVIEINSNIDEYTYTRHYTRARTHSFSSQPTALCSKAGDNWAHMRSTIRRRVTIFLLLYKNPLD